MPKTRSSIAERRKEASKYIGVYVKGRRNRYYSTIRRRKVYTNLGSFSDPKDAAEAYDAGLIKYCLEGIISRKNLLNARFNFPEIAAAQITQLFPDIIQPLHLKSIHETDKSKRLKANTTQDEQPAASISDEAESNAGSIDAAASEDLGVDEAAGEDVDAASTLIHEDILSCPDYGAETDYLNPWDIDIFDQETEQYSPELVASNRIAELVIFRSMALSAAAYFQPSLPAASQSAKEPDIAKEPSLNAKRHRI
jgi:hypothetical protein